MGLLSNGEASGDTDVPVGNPIVAYYAYRRLIGATDLTVAQLVGEQDLGEPGVMAFAFERRTDGERFYVVWSHMPPSPCASP